MFGYNREKYGSRKKSMISKIGGCLSRYFGLSTVNKSNGCEASLLFCFNQAVEQLYVRVLFILQEVQFISLVQQN